MKSFAGTGHRRLRRCPGDGTCQRSVVLPDELWVKVILLLDVSYSQPPSPLALCLNGCPCSAGGSCPVWYGRGKQCPDPLLNLSVLVFRSSKTSAGSVPAVESLTAFVFSTKTPSVQRTFRRLKPSISKSVPKFGACKPFFSVIHALW